MLAPTGALAIMGNNQSVTTVEGRVLGGRYQVGPTVGLGGMARVYGGVDRVLGRPVAIKVPLAPYEADPRFVERFRREARAAAVLTHPNVVRVFDAGSDDGVDYMVMEYVEGRTLADLIREQGPLEPRRAAEVAIAICDALSAAHSAGMVHRDVKPGNVMIDGAGHVRVMDFGIARALAGTTFTRPGSTMGTAAYLSPEQAAGKPADARSDLYSVGCTLYEMLTGRPPFLDEDPFVVASPRTVGDPPAPRSLDPRISPQTEEIVLRALRRDPRERYPSAAAMQADLDAHERLMVSGLAARLRPVTRWRRGLRLARYVLVVAVLPIAAQVALFGLVWWHFGHRR